uniref:TOX high mobility group box family member 4 n=2 Tax=Lygus hesperus TaxID=30085 RepID=A0A0A9YP38_LYGHE
MEATYCIGSDMDVCRMFDQYLYKRNTENLDVALSVPSHHQNGYTNMNEQTFHTPSFGDEDFDIPPINPHQNSGQQQMPSYHPPISMPHTQSTMTMSEHSTYHQPLYLSPPQEHMGMGMPYNNQHNQQNGYRMQSQTQNSLAQLQQYSNMGPPQSTMRSPQSRQATSPPQGSLPHETTTNTSDDSDDSTPHSHLVTGMKRPSPEPTDSSIAKMQKKPKTQKKKKKRDPNEPQKPVSAYALFFRDTQAAIKGSNPNASFGEVSKIVASMWDALDAEHKNVYKKKTEAAKKDYLKALAAYRASLVSKGGSEQEPMYGGYGGYGGGYSGYSPPTGLPSPPVPSPPNHMKNHLINDNRPPMQQVMMGHMNQQPQQHLSQQQQAPPQQQMNANSNSYMHQQQWSWCYRPVGTGPGSSQ